MMMTLTIDSKVSTTMAASQAGTHRLEVGLERTEAVFEALRLLDEVGR